MTKTQKWVAATAIVCVVIVAAGWFLLAKPQKSKIASLHTQTQSQLSSNALLLTQVRALQAEQKELPQQQLIEQKFSSEIPDNAAEPTLIRQLSATAKAAGVDLTSFAPGAPTQVSVAAAPATQSLGAAAASPSAGLFSISLSMNVTGTYANIESWFNGLEHLPRALIVTTFSLAGSGSSGGSGPQMQMASSMSGSVFFAPGSAPIPIPTPSPTASSAPVPTGTPAPVSPPTGAASTPPAAVSSTTQASEPPLQPNG
ncbi:MAG TPA: hypothetical protein VHC43_05825 [Mycobacteriales bacterium]|nr:hypothetical protein [Mycobacteriales bacterium]